MIQGLFGLKLCVTLIWNVFQKLKLAESLVPHLVWWLNAAQVALQALMFVLHIKCTAQKGDVSSLHYNMCRVSYSTRSDSGLATDVYTWSRAVLNHMDLWFPWCHIMKSLTCTLMKIFLMCEYQVPMFEPCLLCWCLHLPPVWRSAPFGIGCVVSFATCCVVCWSVTVCVFLCSHLKSMAFWMWPRSRRTARKYGE